VTAQTDAPNAPYLAEDSYRSSHFLSITFNSA